MSHVIECSFNIFDVYYLLVHECNLFLQSKISDCQLFSLADSFFFQNVTMMSLRCQFDCCGYINNTVKVRVILRIEKINIFQHLNLAHSSYILSSGLGFDRIHI